MAVEWCQPCKARGRLSLARHDVKCTLMCDECFSGRASRGVLAALVKREPAPVKNSGEEKKMAIRLEEATKTAIRRDAEGGMSIADICTKHSVSWPTAKQYAGGAQPAAKKIGRPKIAASAGNLSADTNRATAMVAAEPETVELGPLSNRVRFILLDAQISSGGLAELTKSVVEALKK